MCEVLVRDNGGKTFDRYTIYVSTDIASIYGASENPYHPQGFGQFCGNLIPGKNSDHLGAIVPIESLPIDVQKFISDKIEEYGIQERQNDDTFGGVIGFDDLTNEGYEFMTNLSINPVLTEHIYRCPHQDHEDCKINEFTPEEYGVYVSLVGVIGCRPQDENVIYVFNGLGFRPNPQADITAIINNDRQTIQVIKSKFIRCCCRASLCYPKQGELTEVDEYGWRTYSLPESYIAKPSL